MSVEFTCRFGRKAGEIERKREMKKECGREEERIRGGWIGYEGDVNTKSSMKTRRVKSRRVIETSA